MFKKIQISKDTYISKKNPDVAYGQSNVLYISKGKFHDEIIFNTDKENIHEFRTLLKFDVFDIATTEQELDEFDEVLLRLPLIVFNISEPFDLGVYALTKEFSDGKGQAYYIEDGSTWNESEPQSAWQTAGGDFNDNITYPFQIDDQKNYLTVDVKEFCRGVINGTITNHGLILVPLSKSYNVSLNSSNTLNHLRPFVIATKSDRIIELDDPYFTYEKVEPRKNGLIISEVPYTSIVTSGQDIMLQFNLIDQFPSSFYKNKSVKPYSEDLTYSIVYENENIPIISFDENLPVNFTNDVHNLRFSTRGFRRGNYYVMVKYDDDHSIYYSRKIKFLVQ